MGTEDFFRFINGSAFQSGDEVVFCHDFTDGFFHIKLKDQISVGDDAHKLSFLCNGHTADSVSSHELVGFS